MKPHKVKPSANFWTEHRFMFPIVQGAGLFFSRKVLMGSATMLTLLGSVGWGGITGAIAFSPSDLDDLQTSRVCPKCDLRDADLRGDYLEGANLRDARLSDTDLRRANLRNSDLRDADLTNVDLRGADLRGANLRGALLEGANLMHVQMDDSTRLDRRWLEVVTLVNDLNRDRDWEVDEDLGEQADITDLLRQWAGIDVNDAQFKPLFDAYENAGFNPQELQRILGLLNGVLPLPTSTAIASNPISSDESHQCDDLDEPLNVERFDFVNLVGANFSHANLQGLNFRCENLTAALFQGADLRGSELDRIEAEGSQWAIANLFDATLTEANLAQAQFPAANLDHATLINAVAPESNFQGVTAIGGKFNGILLEDANLQGGDFSGSFFAPSSISEGDVATSDVADGDVAVNDGTEEDSRQTNLEGANLAMANFRGADLSGARLYRTEARGIQFDGSTILSGADLRRMELQGANLAGVHLNETNLAGSDLTDANLMGAQMNGTDLTGATLTNANLRGVDLRSLTLQNTNLQGIQVDPRPDFSALDFQSPQFQQQDANRIIRRLNLDAVAQELDSLTDPDAPERNLVLEGVDLSEVDLIGADFSGMTLRRVNLANANLERASFLGATLEDVNLTGANLQYANLQKATLIRTNFEGADLSHAYFGAHDPDRHDNNRYWGVSIEESNICEALPEIGRPPRRCLDHDP